MNAPPLVFHTHTRNACDKYKPACRRVRIIRFSKWTRKFASRPRGWWSREAPTRLPVEGRSRRGRVPHRGTRTLVQPGTTLPATPAWPEILSRCRISARWPYPPPFSPPWRRQGWCSSTWTRTATTRSERNLLHRGWSKCKRRNGESIIAYPRERNSRDGEFFFLANFLQRFRGRAPSLPTDAGRELQLPPLRGRPSNAEDADHLENSHLGFGPFRRSGGGRGVDVGLREHRGEKSRGSPGRRRLAVGTEGQAVSAHGYAIHDTRGPIRILQSELPRARWDEESSPSSASQSAAATAAASAASATAATSRWEVRETVEQPTGQCFRGRAGKIRVADVRGTVGASRNQESAEGTAEKFTVRLTV